MTERASGDVSLAELLMDHPALDDEPLLFGPDDMLTAGAARALAVEVAAELRAVGVGVGHAVAVQLPDGPGLIATMFGVWLADAVFVPVNPRAPAAEVDRILAATEPAAFVRDDVEAVAGARRYDPGIAFVMWTSGTTGTPKAILHSHAAYFELLDRVLAPLRAAGAASGGAGSGGASKRPTAPTLVPVPLTANAGIYNVLFGLRAGAPIVVLGPFSTARFAEVVASFGIRSTVLPPAAMTMLADDATVTDLAPLRYVRSITAPLSPLQARRFTERFGVTVLNGYGQAEIGEVIGWTAADAREHPEKIGSIGRPHPGVDIKVVPDSEDDEVGGIGVVGRLWVRPPNMAAGDAAGDGWRERLDADGYLDTGDVARIDTDGFVWIEGRAGDVINRGGNKIFPEQVDEVLRLADAVVDAATVGVPDDRLGEVPVSFVVTADTDSFDAAALQTLCREHLVPYKVPVVVYRVDALPRSEVGKIDRRALVAWHTTGGDA